MVYINDLQQLVTQWANEARTHIHPSLYNDALLNCIYDLNGFINNTLSEEMTQGGVSDHNYSLDADYYSNFEPEEFYATAV